MFWNSIERLANLADLPIHITGDRRECTRYCKCKPFFEKTWPTSIVHLREHLAQISKSTTVSSVVLRPGYGAPFVKILYLIDLAQKVLSLRIYSYLCTDLIISACRDVISGRDSHLCMNFCLLESLHEKYTHQNNVPSQRKMSTNSIKRSHAMRRLLEKSKILCISLRTIKTLSGGRRKIFQSRFWLPQSTH